MLEPTALDWIAVALQARENALGRIGTCNSLGCMCSPGDTGHHHATDCYCYDSRHAMIELAKANNQFAADVRKALKCSGPDSS